MDTFWMPGNLGAVLAWIGAGLGILVVLFRIVVAFGPWWMHHFIGVEKPERIMFSVSNRSHVVARDVRLYVAAYPPRKDWGMVMFGGDLAFNDGTAISLSTIPDDWPMVQPVDGKLVWPKGFGTRRRIKVRIEWSAMPFLPLRHKKVFKLDTKNLQMAQPVGDDPAPFFK